MNMDSCTVTVLLYACMHQISCHISENFKFVYTFVFITDNPQVIGWVFFLLFKMDTFSLYYTPVACVTVIDALYIIYLYSAVNTNAEA